MQMTDQKAEPGSTILVDIRDVSVSKELPRKGPVDKKKNWAEEVFPQPT